VQFVNAALKLMPEAPELYDTRAFVLEASGSTEAALSDIRQAVRLDPAEPRYRLRLVEMLDSANRSREATDELKSLEAMPYDKDSLSPEQSRQLAQLHKRLLTLASAQN
jgi:Flp pilus assembly protein TadD